MILQSYIRNFQKTKISDKNCSSAVCWYQLYPFIEYSVQKDAIYCFRCRLFASQSGSADKVFTTNGFRNWKKVGEKSKKHSESVSHKDRMTKWTAYKQTKATSTVADQLSQRAATIAAKIYYNSSKNSCFYACAQQGIVLRGHDETSTSSNKGNFVEILELLASLIPELQCQLQIMLDIQNDLLKAATDTVLRHIINEVKESEWYAIIADETQDIGKKEQLSLCIRYVNNQLQVNEHSIGFSDLCDLDAKALAGKIVERLQVLGLHVKKCLSQCYDGASVMSELHHRFGEHI